ncbi:MAG TPA: DHA2 family efflux MFS transporter permease subunit [Candidatus Paceibacterota bacterium]|nr:DHA2 family efflux MFS transporter permease subunit [Candidatus Paceibacterota bacterium]
MLQSIDKRWLALFILCLGDLMIVLDMSVANVALPSIRNDLGFSETSLVWVINAYMLTFSGFLLLGGRLGDLFGNRKMFLFGIGLFTLASLICGIATSQWVLVVARALQGIGGAIFSAVALAIIINLFTDPGERARAMGFWGFVAAGGGAIGVLVGGVLTGTFDWHWIFLINIPVGLAVFALCFYLLPPSPGIGADHIDFAGAITVTLSLILAVYAIVNGNAAGWFSLQTIGTIVASALLFAFFIFRESRAQKPLVPLHIFRLGNISAISIIGILWSVAMFAWFFLAALYLQLVLGYSPMEVGLAFLGPNLIMAAFSWGLSAKMVMRFGTKWPIVVGMGCIALGLFLFTLAPQTADFYLHVLPGMLLLGLGAGIAFNPVLLAGMSGIPEEESGLASGVLNTAFMMGGALGLAVLVSLAAYRTASLAAQGTEQTLALLGGYHMAFFIGAVFAVFAALVAIAFLREEKGDSLATSAH